MSTNAGFSGATLAHQPSSRKLFELRPFCARLITWTPGLKEARKPGPHPPSSLTVESPTRTILTGAAAIAKTGTAKKIRRRRIIEVPDGHYPIPLPWGNPPQVFDDRR